MYIQIEIEIDPFAKLLTIHNYLKNIRLHTRQEVVSIFLDSVAIINKKKLYSFSIF